MIVLANDPSPRSPLGMYGLLPLIELPNNWLDTADDIHDFSPELADVLRAYANQLKKVISEVGLTSHLVADCERVAIQGLLIAHKANDDGTVTIAKNTVQFYLSELKLQKSKQSV